jgi:PAS domain S-box-containing protein
VNAIRGGEAETLGTPPGAGPTRRRGHERERASLLLLGAAILFPLLLAALGMALAWRNEVRDATAELERSADAAAEYGRRVLDGHRAAVDRVSDLLRGLTDAGIRAREAELHAALRALLADAPMLQTAYAADRHGRLLLSGSVVPVPRDVDFSDREFHRLLQGPDSPPVVVTRLYRGRLEGNVFFAVGRRRIDSGNPDAGPDGFDGQINVAVDPRQVAAGLRRIRAGQADVLALTRSDGQILVRSDGFEGLPPPLAQDGPLSRIMQRQEERGSARGSSASDGAMELAAYRRVEGWPVYVSVARPQAVVVARWRQSALPQAVLGFAASALLAALSLAVLRKQRQLAQMNAALEGRVAERTAALAGREAEYRATFEDSPVALAQCDPRTARFVRVNPAYCALTGQTEAELLGGLTPSDLTHPDDRADDAARFRRTVETGARYTIEKRYLRRDGCVVWVQVSAGLIRDPRTGAPLRTIASAQDITERRRAQERLLLLAREVDHRAKNALAVVQAAVRLAPKTDPAAFVRAVEGRIAALARAQVVLAGEGWRGAELRVLAEGALATFLPDGPPGEMPGNAPAEMAEGAPRAVISGPQVFLAATAVQPLGLALHELATNASKYGALSVAGGRVGLDWWVEPEAGLLRLHWREAGGPPVAAPARRGFGTRVLDATICEQLGGSVRRDWVAGGLVCDIALPLRRVAGMAERQVAPPG